MSHYRKAKKGRGITHSSPRATCQKKGMLPLKQNYQEFVTPEAARKSTVTGWGRLTQTALGHTPAVPGAGGSPCLLLAPTNTLVPVFVLPEDEQDQKADPTKKQPPSKQK